MCGTCSLLSESTSSVILRRSASSASSIVSSSSSVASSCCGAGKGSQPLGWEEQAALALSFHERADAEVLERAAWGWWSLRFPTVAAERAFGSYFTRLHADTARRGLLALVSAHALYSMAVWKEADHAAALAVRVLYAGALLAAFTASTVWEAFFRRNVQAFAAALLAATSAAVVAEAALQGGLFGHATGQALVLFLVAAPLVVRLRFVAALAVCLGTMLAFGAAAAADPPAGADARAGALRTAAAMAAACALVAAGTRRDEVAMRYHFLHSLRLGLESAADDDAVSPSPSSSSSLAEVSAVAAAAAECGDGQVVLRQRRVPGRGRRQRRMGSVFGGGNGDKLARRAAARPPAASSGPPRLVRQRSSIARLVQAPVDQVQAVLRESGSSLINFLEHERTAEELEGDGPQRTKYELVGADRLPPYHAPYDYVLGGYRANFTAALCVRSLFRMHNETVNVWSELLPCVAGVVGVAAALAWSPALAAAPATDVAFVALCGLAVLVVRPLVSGLAHLMHCQSRRAFVLWWVADYLSICLCVLGGALVYARFTFYCRPVQGAFFMTTIVGLFFSTVLTVVFVNENGARVASFVLFAVCSHVIPFAFAFVGRGSSADSVPLEYLGTWASSISLMGTGLLAKSLKAPERFWPGRFDIWLASHQFWHVFVNAANVLTFLSWLTYLEWRQASPCDGLLA